MTWVLLFASLFLIFFVLIKLFEQKIQRRVWLTKFLLKQDYSLERLVSFLFIFKKSLEKRIKFLIFVQVPFFAGFILRKSLVKIIDRTQEIKENVRGKIKVKSEHANASPFLKEIAKIKSRKGRERNFIE